MGVDTKGCLLTPTKNVWLVTSLAEKALSKLLRQGRAELFPGFRGHNEDTLRNFSDVQTSLITWGEMVELSFTCFEEKRSIKVFFTCDCDHFDLGPRSISFSMGCWGLSELYAKAILHAWSLLGPVYVDVNDCDSIDMAPLDAEPITLFQAVALDYVQTPKAEDFVSAFLAGDLGSEQSFEQFAGVSLTEWEDLQAIDDVKTRWDAMDRLANDRYPAEAALPLLPLVAGEDVLAA